MPWAVLSASTKKYNNQEDKSMKKQYRVLFHGYDRFGDTYTNSIVMSLDENGVELAQARQKAGRTIKTIFAGEYHTVLVDRIVPAENEISQTE